MGLSFDSSRVKLLATHHHDIARGGSQHFDDWWNPTGLKTIWKWSSLSLLLLFVFLSVFYYLLPQVIFSTDYLPNTLLPYSMLKNSSVYLDDFAYINEEYSKVFTVVFTLPSGLQVQNHGAYYAPYVGGHYVSAYPILIPLLAVPLYAVYFLFTGMPTVDHWILIAGGAGVFSGAVLSALAVCILLVFFRKLNERTADYIIFAYAFGTLLLSVANVLNNHLAGLIFLPLAWFYALKSNEKDQPHAIGWAGLFAALAFAGRPTNIVSYGILVLYCLATKKDLTRFVLLSLPVFALLFSYNYLLFGSPFDSGYRYIYSLSHDQNTPVPSITDLFHIGGNTPVHFLALLFSPNRGIFFFSPFLLFAFLGIRKAFSVSDPAAVLMRFITLAFFASVALFAMWFLWTGGFRYGYVLLLDTIVYPALLVSYASEEIFSRKSLLLVFVLFVLLSVPIAFMGLTYGCDWNLLPNDLDHAQYRVWDFGDLEMTRCIRNMLAPTSRPPV